MRPRNCHAGTDACRLRAHADRGRRELGDERSRQAHSGLNPCEERDQRPDRHRERRCPRGAATAICPRTAPRLGADEYDLAAARGRSAFAQSARQHQRRRIASTGELAAGRASGGRRRRRKLSRSMKRAVPARGHQRGMQRRISGGAQEVAVEKHASPLRQGCPAGGTSVERPRTVHVRRPMASAGTPWREDAGHADDRRERGRGNQRQSANVAPIVIPMAAIARDRRESQCGSAARAITAAEIAPARLNRAAGDRPFDRRRPCGDEAAEREDGRPVTMTGFRPAVRRPAERHFGACVSRYARR